MNVSDFQKLLNAHPAASLIFMLPDGGEIAPHAHVTEVGRVEKTFIDCGGTLRKNIACTLQVWEADDFNHRLLAGKLAAVMDKAAAIVGHDDPAVEIEYQDGSISQFPVLTGEFVDESLRFSLGIKNTACLAQEVCLPSDGESECGGSGCC